MTVGKTKTSIPEEILCKVTDRAADRIQEWIEADRKRKQSGMCIRRNNSKRNSIKEK